MTNNYTIRLRRFRKDTSGANAVEFGIIAGVLTFIIMGVVELGLMMGAQGTLDNVAFTASRVGKTGYSASGSTQAKTITAAVQKAASDYIDHNKIRITSTAYDSYDSIGKPEPFTDTNKNGKRDNGESFTDVNGNGSYDTDRGKTGAGSAKEIVVYTAAYDWRFITPIIGRLIGTNGVLTLKSRIVVKNEPYG